MRNLFSLMRLGGWSRWLPIAAPLLLPLAGRAQTPLGTITTNQTLPTGTYTFSLAAGQGAQLEGWGGGGAGGLGANNGGASGGGGGAYATQLVVGPATYTVQVGAGATFSPAAAATQTRVTDAGATVVLQAAPGANGLNGTGANPPGGSGGQATASVPQNTAQPGAAGGLGFSGSSIGGDGGSGGSGGNNGGAGGAGGAGRGNSGPGATGSAPGGGGGGGGYFTGSGGNGGGGQLRITLAPTITLTQASTSLAPGLYQFSLTAGQSAQLQGWGGGGAGSGDGGAARGGGGGGGGGAYATVTVTGPATYVTVVGAGGTSSMQATATQVNSSSTTALQAAAGSIASNAIGGTGGQATASVPAATAQAGGNGANGVGNGSPFGGIGGAGGSGGGPGGGGGGSGGGSFGVAGGSGSAPGGGGGGGVSQSGGNGGNGRLTIALLITAPATVTTAAPASITSTSATLGGNVTADGGATITERGVVYVAGSGTPTTSDTKRTATGTTGAYTVSATGLTTGTLYTTRAYAINSAGTSYGSSQPFTTAAALAASTSRTNVSCFGGSNGTATVTATGGVTPYTYSWNTSPVQTTATATGLPAGTYTVTVTDNAGQTTTATATITQPSALTVSTSKTDATTNGGNDGTATATPSGGTPGYSYSWSPSGGSAATATGLGAGTYTVTVTDANGCTTTSTATVGQPAATVATGTIASPLCAGSAVSVPFTANGTIGRLNVYTAQLSDASGSFASPVNIGTFSSPGATSGTIAATVPAGTGAGTGYRIQVVALTPGFTPIPNTSDLTINNTAAPTGAASQSFSSGATVANLAATGTAIQWYAASTGGSALAATTPLTNGTTYYASQTANGCESLTRLAVTATVAATPGALTVSTGTLAAPTSIPAGTYTTVTVTGTGNAILGGAVVVSTGLTVQGGGSLNTNCQSLTGAGDFTLAAGALLAICDANGIAGSGPMGAVQVSGTRSFSPDASYVYNGTAAQNTGTGLPNQVRNLTTTNANAVTLTAPTAVGQALTVAAAGNLVLNGQALTLRSSASGTALAVNSGTGVVLGTATVQRYIDGSLNSGPGYRHYSAPVSNTTVADLATAGFAPVLTQSYNTSATPGTTTPFPNVFGYDQGRLITAANSNYSPFDKGFFVPQATDPLTPGLGYAVNIGAGPLVDFQGTLGTGDLTLNLTRNAGATAADAGWQLVGNPYPAPLDWSQVASADRTNLDAAVYVVQSTGQYAGGYRAYVNGQSTTGTNNPLLATAQGFWVRVSPGQTTGALTFRNSQRVSDYATAQQTTFQRGTADMRPALRLTLAGAGLADGWVTYADADATPGFDREFDAAKLPNGHGLNLSSAGSSPLAIDGQPAFTLATVLPLAVGVPAAGSYTLTATALANLPAGLTAYLRDAQTGQTLALTAGTSYSFAVTAGQAQSLLTGRFTVQFAPAAPLAATSAALSAAVSVYPNPARAQATVAVPGLAGASAVQVELLNALGQVVLRQQAALPAGGTQLVLPTAGLATGVYVVRLAAGQLLVTKRLTIE